MAVAMGTSNTINSQIEIIDLENPSNVCSNLPNYPLPLIGSMGSLNSQGQPFICGGHNGATLISTCYKYINNTWIKFPPMNVKRCAGALSNGNWFNQQRRHLVTGTYLGSASDAATGEILTENGWQMLNISLPYNISEHCSVMMNSSTALVIGGYSNNAPINKTFFINLDENTLREGPVMNSKRSYHSCGRILVNDTYLIIAVGGEIDLNNNLDSVEILDEKTFSWKLGPKLPYGITRASIVEDPMGGIIVIEGKSPNVPYLNSMVRLRNANLGILLNFIVFF